MRVIKWILVIVVVGAGVVMWQELTARDAARQEHRDARGQPKTQEIRSAEGTEVEGKVVEVEGDSVVLEVSGEQFVVRVGSATAQRLKVGQTARVRTTPGEGR